MSHRPGTSRKRSRLPRPRTPSPVPRPPSPVGYVDLTDDSVIQTPKTRANRIFPPSLPPPISLLDETIVIPDESPVTIRIPTPRRNARNRDRVSPLSPQRKNASRRPAKRLENDLERIPKLNDSKEDQAFVLTCPVCFENLIESRKPTSTKCGHIFCESCIQNVLSTNKKCPLCMTSITQKSCIRLHF